MTSSNELYIECDPSTLVPDPVVIEGDSDLYYARKFDEIQARIRTAERLSALRALETTSIVAIVNQTPQEAIQYAVTQPQ